MFKILVSQNLYRIQFRNKTNRKFTCIGKTTSSFGNFFVSDGTFTQIIKKSMNVLPGNIIFFVGREKPRFRGIYIKNIHVCGFISEDRKYLILHGENEFKIPIAESLNILEGEIDENSVYIAELKKRECYNLKYIGKNTDINTQEICLYINSGIASWLDEVYTCKDIPKQFEDIEFESEGVYDMTNHITFCIDPIDAKDADDALSIFQLSEDLFEVGIHIADVTRYIHDTKILESAVVKSNSWFLYNSCIPMFTKNLATSIFSFVPGKTRPTISIVFKFENDKIFDMKVVLGKIKVDYSISYGYAEKLLKTTTQSELNHLAKLTNIKISLEALIGFHKLNEIAKKLKKDRIDKFSPFFFPNIAKNQSIIKDFKTEFDEFDIKKSSMIIEEFMLYANNTVADILSSSPKNLALFRKCYHREALYYRDNFNDEISLLRNVFCGEYLAFADFLAIKKLEPSFYTFEKEKRKNGIDHFILGFPNYVHFTSPIRRFADITVHLALKEFLFGTKNINWVSKNKYKTMHLCNINFRVSKISFDKSLLANIHKYLEENPNMTCDAIFYNNLLFIPKLGITLKNYEFLKLEKYSCFKIKLVPGLDNGLLTVYGKIIKKSDFCISDRDRNLLFKINN